MTKKNIPWSERYGWCVSLEMGSFFLEPRKSLKILIFSSLWHHWILSRWCSFPPPRWAEGNSAARDDIMRWSNVKNGTVAIDPVPPKIIKHIWYYKMIQETLIQCLATEMHIILHNLYLNWIYSDLWYISLTCQTSSRWNMVNQPVHMPGIFEDPSWRCCWTDSERQERKIRCACSRVVMKL